MSLKCDNLEWIRDSRDFFFSLSFQILAHSFCSKRLLFQWKGKKSSSFLKTSCKWITISIWLLHWCQSLDVERTMQCWGSLLFSGTSRVPNPQQHLLHELRITWDAPITSHDTAAPRTHLWEVGRPAPETTEAPSEHPPTLPSRKGLFCPNGSECSHSGMFH